MNRDERKALAQQTLDIIKNGTYNVNGCIVDITQAVETCRRESRLIRPADGLAMIQKTQPDPDVPAASMAVRSQSTFEAIQDFHKAGASSIGVLNFASAKNAGGGFLNGSLAQEESLALSSNLYNCQIKHAEYYDTNRQFRSMIYTDYAIFSPGILFFRADSGALLNEPLQADVLTLPAVNFGQVIQKGEDQPQAKKAMFERMRRCLCIFHQMGCENLVLGAYGCGVFRNDPEDVAKWWKQLLTSENYGSLFRSITFAVLDRSKSQACLKAFEAVFQSS